VPSKRGCVTEFIERFLFRISRRTKRSSWWVLGTGDYSYGALCDSYSCLGLGTPLGPNSKWNKTPRRLVEAKLTNDSLCFIHETVKRDREPFDSVHIKRFYCLHPSPQSISLLDWWRVSSLSIVRPSEQRTKRRVVGQRLTILSCSSQGVLLSKFQVTVPSRNTLGVFESFVAEERSRLLRMMYIVSPRLFREGHQEETSIAVTAPPETKKMKSIYYRQGGSSTTNPARAPTIK
jgi:hypothetical protein